MLGLQEIGIASGGALVKITKVEGVFERRAR